MTTMDSLKFGSFGFLVKNEGVIKGLCDRDEHVMVLSGAYLSSRSERTELKSWR